MEEPIHTHHTQYYFVNRPILWFPAGGKIPVAKIQEYFTQKAIQSLLKYDFLTIVNK
jgi:hypothetical protein